MGTNSVKPMKREISVERVQYAGVRRAAVAAQPTDEGLPALLSPHGHAARAACQETSQGLAGFTFLQPA